MQEYTISLMNNELSDDVRVTCLERIVCWKLKSVNFSKRIKEHELENKTSAIYILLDQTNLPKYIGESNDCLSRIKKHQLDKDWIESIILIFSDKDSSQLSKDDLRYYEAEIINNFNEKGIALDNKEKNYNKKINSVDKQMYIEEFKTIKNLLTFLIPDYIVQDSVKAAEDDYDDVVESINTVTTNKEIIKGLYNKNNGSITILNKQFYSVNEYDGDSKNKKYWSDTLKTLKKLDKQGLIKYHYDNFKYCVEIIKNLKFTYPSGASCFIHGRSRNGRTDWKLENGKPLKTVIKTYY